MSKEKRWNLICAAFCIVLAIFILYLTLTTFVKEKATVGGPFANTAFYPRLLAGAIIFLSLLLAVTALMKKTKRRRTYVGMGDVDSFNEAGKKELSEQDTISRGMLLALPFILVTYTILLDIFGYIVVTPVFMILLFWILKFRNWAMNIILSMIATFTLYLIFALFLNVILPRGRFPLIGW
jgi:putative tricarboxylic transport membrane protein